MIIVCGRFLAHAGRRQELLDLSRLAVVAARNTEGCIDFAVSPDLIDADRVNILERWTSAEALRAFREDGPGEDISGLVRQFDIEEFEVSARR
ncbi:MAG TPA: antibiotic biosynthesis monooxygenase [Devosia sp.]